MISDMQFEMMGLAREQVVILKAFLDKPAESTVTSVKLYPLKISGGPC